MCASTWASAMSVRLSGDIDRLAVLAADLAGAVRGIERHSDVVVAVKVEDDVAEHLEVAADLAGRDECH